MKKEKMIEKFINNAFINALNISKEEGIKYYPLYKSFVERNYSAQEEECKKLGLSKPHMYGIYTHTNYFGEFISKIITPGHFEPLWDINEISQLGYYHSAPRWDKKHGINVLKTEEGETFEFKGKVIFPTYLQVKNLQTGKYMPINEVYKRLQAQGRKLPDELMEYLYDSVNEHEYIPMKGDAIDLLVTASYAGVLPTLLEEGDPLKEVFQRLYEGGYTTPPAMGDERYDNALTPEVWERDEDTDLERDLQSPSLEKVLTNLSYLENSSLPKAKEVKASYWSKEGLNIKLLWRDLQKRGYAETLTWEGWEEDPDMGSYEEKTLWSLKSLRSLTKEELQTLLQMREDTLLAQVGYSSLQANPCRVYKDPQKIQGKKHEVQAHVNIPW